MVFSKRITNGTYLSEMHSEIPSLFVLHHDRQPSVLLTYLQRFVLIIYHIITQKSVNICEFSFKTSAMFASVTHCWIYTRWFVKRSKHYPSWRRIGANLEGKWTANGSSLCNVRHLICCFSNTTSYYQSIVIYWPIIISRLNYWYPMKNWFSTNAYHFLL